MLARDANQRSRLSTSVYIVRHFELLFLGDNVVNVGPLSLWYFFRKLLDLLRITLNRKWTLFNGLMRLQLG